MTKDRNLHSFVIRPSSFIPPEVIMKIFDIAAKDMRRYFRSPFALGMMFIAPLLITALLFLAFGNMKSGGGKFNLPPTRIAVANLDEPDPNSDLAAGKLLLSHLQSPGLGDMFQVTTARDDTSARAAVDQRQADVAVIIPANLTSAVLTPGVSALVLLYHDPTLTVGPSVVKIIISSFIDDLAGAKIAVQVAQDQLATQGVEIDSPAALDIAQRYVSWIDSTANPGASKLAVIRPPASENQAAQSQNTTIGAVMAGMMIMFVFFTGASSASSIVMEDEEGTLARLFTTPTSHISILGGKFAAVLLILIVQVAVLMLLSKLLFGVYWGASQVGILLAAAMIFAAAGFGVLLMSFLKNMRQAGPVMGGALTLMGLVGGLFTVAIPNIPASFERIYLSMPQGWALHGWRLAQAGASLSETLLPATVLIGAGCVFFLIGVVILRKRFA
jgi:ABC-2 type transport system permease protein